MKAPSLSSLRKLSNSRVFLSFRRATPSTIALRHSVSHSELTWSVFKFFNLIIDKRGQWCRLELRLGSFTTSRAQLMPSSLPSLWFLRVFQCSFHATHLSAGRKRTHTCLPRSSLLRCPHPAVEQPCSLSLSSQSGIQALILEQLTFADKPRQFAALAVYQSPRSR